MDFTQVGDRISVGSDAPSDACGGFGLVVLASAEHQHYGDKYDGKVLRVPMVDQDQAPSVEMVKRAQAAAERVAFAANRSAVPYDVYKKFAPKNPLDADEDPNVDVLVTCEMGENRSLYIAGMALVLTGCQESGEDARQYMQKLRGPRAFYNKHLMKLLDNYYPASLKLYRQPSIKDGEMKKVVEAGTHRGGFDLKAL